MEKIWSYAIKMAAVKEVLKNPDKEHWHEARLPLRFQEIRSAMQRYLSNEKMTDPFYPEVNMMERIKSTNVKQGVAKYLSRYNSRDIFPIWDLFRPFSGPFQALF